METFDSDESINQLQKVVERQHGGRTIFIRAESVKITLKGEIVGEVAVHIFDLYDHPTAARAYAWSSSVDGSDTHRFHTVLQSNGINSAPEAVAAVAHSSQNEDREAERSAPGTSERT